MFIRSKSAVGFRLYDRQVFANSLKYRQDFIYDKLYPYLVDSIKIILDLIEKQQKEIEILRGIFDDDLPF